MGLISLKSTDDKIVKVERKAVRFSSTLVECLEYFGEVISEPIPVQRATEEVLRKVSCLRSFFCFLTVDFHVLEWCNHHKDDDEAIEELQEGVEEGEEPVKPHSEWDQLFLKDVNNSFLIDLVLAVEYLGMKELVTLFAKEIAQRLKGKTKDEIGQFFDIKNDFTETELEKLKISEPLWIAH
ncbi:hypothetical protein L596_017008 [Steinernema carpocapsae]|uniref:Skp1-related protein n=1 Tax=Steinernema carpocapsae TaxID=34508 RepID=A0A4V6XW28_STECR|nr:hypothetical protein L596_017008 [Steinernema carpocapsae]